MHRTTSHDQEGTPVSGTKSSPSPHEIRVIDGGRRQAQCSCGWTGRLRMLKATAAQEGWGHAIKTGHLPAEPFFVAMREAVAR